MYIDYSTNGANPIKLLYKIYIGERMTFMRKLSIIMILFFIISLSGCKKEVLKPQDIKFSDVLEQVNAERKNPKTLDIPVEKYASRIEDSSDDLTTEEINNLIISSNESGRAKLLGYKASKEISKDKAIEDINYVFKLLKYGYGPYEYFGGEKSFNEAKTRVLAELDKYKTIKTEDIKGILLKELSFIKDKHFQVGDSNLTVIRTNYYSNEDLEFYKDDKGFFTIEKNKKYYLLKVNEDNNIENYLKLSINPEGKLLYYIGLISKDSIDRVDVTLKESEKEENRTIELKGTTNLINKEFKVKSEINGIPMVTCRAMSGDQSEFIDTATYLKDKKISVIDLRNNGGGSDSIMQKWIYNYTGKQPSRNGTLIFLNTNLLRSHMGNDAVRAFEQGEITEEEKNHSLKVIADISNESEINTRPVTNLRAEWTENDNIIFVLIDNVVASSGESAVMFLRNMKNVIFVGTNTSGTTLGFKSRYYILPNTKISLRFAETLYLQRDVEVQEGIGFMPDIWTSPNDAADRVLKMIGYYNIN